MISIYLFPRAPCAFILFLGRLVAAASWGLLGRCRAGWISRSRAWRSRVEPKALLTTHRTKHHLGLIFLCSSNRLILSAKKRRQLRLVSLLLFFYFAFFFVTFSLFT